MASGRTTRRALDFPKKTDPDTLTADIQALAEQLDNDSETGQGKVSERPAAKLRGRLFYVIEGSEKGLWWDTGATWVAANALLTEQVEEGNIKNLAVSTAKLAEKAVTDAKVAANRALVVTNNSYSSNSTTPGTKIEPSSTRMAFVSVWTFNYSANGSIQYFEGEIRVGGVEIGRLGYELREPAQGKPNYAAITFLVPPTQKWEFALTAGSVQENRIMYATLLL